MSKKITFLFPGQGSHFVGMARDLYHGFPYIQKLYALANEIAELDITRLSFEGPEDELNKTSINQLAIVMHSVAVLEVLRREVGLEKLTIVATAGLSLGEYVALYFDESITFENLIRQIKHRGIYMQEACEKFLGGMASIFGLDEGKVEAICEQCTSLGEIRIANYLSPKRLVISGSIGALNKAIELAKQQKAKVRQLNVAGAYHSELMGLASAKMVAILQEVEFKKPRIPFITNITAKPVSEPEEIRYNLIRQIISPVYWFQTINEMISLGANEFWELGPGKVLTGLMKEIDSTKTAISFATVEDIERLAEN